MVLLVQSDISFQYLGINIPILQLKNKTNLGKKKIGTVLPLPPPRKKNKSKTHNSLLFSE